MFTKFNALKMNSNYIKTLKIIKEIIRDKLEFNLKIELSRELNSNSFVYCLMNYYIFFRFIIFVF